ncbi:hypothetical protein [Candidatus Laterigemmans baculatus]|uniref:hypothetical protein n=1 Tax=Candidatus Laterigemmans baculatus TaxID=2770505 RepID=UPI0013DCBA0B|nr:hypothetical protein [Candidatus Laterigemmans baculatus]
MRALLVGLALIVLLFVAGWLTFSSGDGDASLNVETETIRQDTTELTEGAEQLVDGVRDKVDVDIEE